MGACIDNRREYHIDEGSLVLELYDGHQSLLDGVQALHELIGAEYLYERPKEMGVTLYPLWSNYDRIYVSIPSISPSRK